MSVSFFTGLKTRETESRHLARFPLGAAEGPPIFRHGSATAHQSKLSFQTQSTHSQMQLGCPFLGRFPFCECGGETGYLLTKPISPS